MRFGPGIDPDPIHTRSGLERLAEDRRPASNADPYMVAKRDCDHGQERRHFCFRLSSTQSTVT